jgi:hypothetical protein
MRINGNYLKQMPCKTNTYLLRTTKVRTIDRITLQNNEEWQQSYCNYTALMEQADIWLSGIQVKKETRIMCQQLHGERQCNISIQISWAVKLFPCFIYVEKHKKRKAEAQNSEQIKHFTWLRRYLQVSCSFLYSASLRNPWNYRCHPPKQRTEAQKKLIQQACIFKFTKHEVSLMKLLQLRR